MRVVGRKPSAASSLDFWVEAFQFRSGIVDFELPIDAALFGVGLFGPGGDFALQFGQFTDPAVAQALTGQAAQLALGDVQPTAVLGRVAEVDSLHVRAGTLRFERFVERSFGVRVAVVADQRHFRAASITPIQQLSDFERPVFLGPPQSGRRLAETRERLAEQEDAGRAIALVLVIDALAVLLRRRDRHLRLLE